MIIDIILLFILTVITALGFRYGFIYTFFHVTGWLIALLSGFILTPTLKSYLIEGDIFYTSIYNRVLSNLPNGFEIHSIEANGIPNILKNLINEYSLDLSNDISRYITDMLMTIISFLIIVVIIKIIMYLIISLFSKKNNNGSTGIIDGILGLAFGFIKGMVVVYVILAIMIPVVNIASPEHTFTILTNLDSSVIAKDLYDNNPILLLIK